MVNLRGFIIRGGYSKCIFVILFFEMISFLLARAQLSVNETRAQSVHLYAFYLPLNNAREPVTEPQNNETIQKHPTNIQGEGNNW